MVIQLVHELKSKDDNGHSIANSLCSECAKRGHNMPRCSLVSPCFVVLSWKWVKMHKMIKRKCCPKLIHVNELQPDGDDWLRGERSMRFKTKRSMRAPFLHSGPSVPLLSCSRPSSLVLCYHQHSIPRNGIHAITIIQMGMCLLSWPRQCPLVVGASECECKVQWNFQTKSSWNYYHSGNLLWLEFVSTL